MYSTSQVKDHKLYHSVYSENPEAFTMSILRSTRYNPGSVYSTAPPRGVNADAFDARPSMDSVREGGGGGGNAHLQGQGGNYRESRYEDAEPTGYEASRAYPNEYDGYAQGGMYDHRGGYGDGDAQQGNGYGHGHGQQESYGNGHGNYPFSVPGGGYVDHPQSAMMRDEEVTPTLNNYSDGQGVGYAAGNGGLSRPEDVQGHPGESIGGINP
jgi:hypothetical protein